MSRVRVPFVARCLQQLLWMRSKAKLSRLIDRVRSPRRLIFTGIAVLLGIFWLGQTVLNLFMRPPADPERLHRWITSGLVMYCFWHLLRSVWSKDIQGIRWSGAEKEFLWTAPLSQAQLITYRFVGMIGPAIVKASLLTTVLLPDAARPELTFLAFLIALCILELSRMVIEILCWGLAPGALRRLRAGVTLVTAGILAALAMRVWTRLDMLDPTMPALQLPSILLGGLMDLADSEIAQLLGLPLTHISAVATSGSWTLDVGQGILIGACLITGLAFAVVRFQHRMTTLRQQHASHLYHALLRSGGDFRDQCTRSVASQKRLRLFRLPRLGGIGPIVSRQLQTLRTYWVVVLVTMLIPSALATFPLWVLPSDQRVLLHVAGSLVFYTLLLGPPALKVDFRRDLDRMMTLRLLPISPRRIVVGQLTMPVMVCVAFQAIVLALAVLCRPTEAGSIAFALAAIVPITLFIFALENAIFLAFPQRIGQEGIDILLRTILVFTLKGLLFGAGLAVMAGWLMMTRLVLTAEFQPIAFQIGGIAILWLVAGLAIEITAIEFRRFCVSVDTPTA